MITLQTLVPDVLNAKNLLDWLLLNPLFTTLFLSSLIEISPIKINPLRWVAKKLANVLVDTIDKSLEIKTHFKRTDDSIKELSDDLSALKADRDVSKTLDRRQRIIRFADEISSGVKHSKELFVEIMRDCDEYDDYCSKHLGFANGCTEAAKRLIRETYERCLKEHTFL